MFLKKKNQNVINIVSHHVITKSNYYTNSAPYKIQSDTFSTITVIEKIDNVKMLAGCRVMNIFRYCFSKIATDGKAWQLFNLL